MGRREAGVLDAVQHFRWTVYKACRHLWCCLHFLRMYLFCLLGDSFWGVWRFTNGCGVVMSRHI